MSPRIAADVWRRWGAPERIIHGIMSLYEGQLRYVEYGGFVCQESVHVSRSLLQGDPISPLALATVLAAPVRKLRSECPETTLSVYADDRAMVSPTEAAADRARQVWAELKCCTAMETNDAKSQQVCIARHTWRKLGKTTVTVLGVVLRLAAGALHCKELGRIDEVRRRLKRVRGLCLNKVERVRAVTSMAMPTLSWALVTMAPSRGAMEKVAYDVKEATLRHQWRNGSRHLLWLTIIGHICPVAA